MKQMVPTWAIISALASPLAVSTEAAADAFDDFFSDVKKGIMYMEAHTASDINGLLSSVQNTNYQYIVLVRMLRNGNEDALKLVQDSDARIVALLAAAEAAAKETQEAADRQKSITFIFQMVNLTFAVSDFVHSVEVAGSAQKSDMLEDVFGEDWSEFEDDFSEFIEESPAINKEVWDEPVHIPAVPDDVPMTLGGAPTEQTKMEFIDDNLKWLEANAPTSGTLDKQKWEEAGRRIQETYRVLYSMSDTAADRFEQEYRLTIEKAAVDLIPDNLQDADLSAGLAKAIEFYFTPQVIGDGTPLGRGARLFKMERLNGFARSYLIQTNKLPNDFINFLDGSMQVKIKDDLACADSGCVTIPEMPLK